MTRHAPLSQSSFYAKYRRRGRAWMLIVMMGTLSFGGLTHAKETQRVEALGVINGNMTARNSQVDITVFLSGQPLFQATEATDAEAISVLTIEQAQLLTQDGKTFRVQKNVTLPDGKQGIVRLPVQVQIDGKPVLSTVTENSLGVVVTLSTPSQRVALMPVGPVQITVPAEYRGDINMQWRVLGDTSLPTE
ncbi:DUF5462 family protein [Providencia sp. Me31A]|uniref:DUF5462 family protein n=1 Tax=Providencia sp. Me31A TaxID=3392637 RepID=UPI003D2B1CB8